MSQNPANEDIRPLIDTLAALTKDWMQSIINALQLYRRVIDIPPPHPDYPLPVEFPFSNLTQAFNWVQTFDDSSQVRRAFRVRLEYYEGRADRWEPLVWSVYSGNIVLGSFQLDRHIYANQALKIFIDPIFILGNLVYAISIRQTLIISTRIAMSESLVGRHVWNEIIEIHPAPLVECGFRKRVQPTAANTCHDFVQASLIFSDASCLA
uniref:Uncharacterized protein n=1 Tax=Moniliophthora roreri TaxID=221103 RepID=A0A0W0FDJ1_MONRR